MTISCGIVSKDFNTDTQPFTQLTHQYDINPRQTKDENNNSFTFDGCVNWINDY